jgi:hypothetical protein
MPAPSAVEDAIINRAAFDAVFGGWSSFHDQLLVALRVTSAGPRAPVLDAEFRVAGGYAERADGYFHATSWYAVTLRFHAVADVVLDGFLPENVVGELQLSAVEAAGGGPPAVRVTLEGIPGCGADLTLVCAAVEVLTVQGPYPPAA